MRLLRVFLGVVCAALPLASAARAQVRLVQARDANRELVLAGGRELRDRGTSVEIELPAGTRLEAVEALADGWVVAGTRTVDGETDLWLATGRGSATEPLTPPPGARGPFVNRPVPLVEHGRLVGLAWLDGNSHDSMAVRAAAWDGKGWDDPITVSAPDLESQLALSGAVLPDGSWQLVWAALDGTDDEIFSARRRVDGAWEPREQLNPPNDVPDIRPQVVATHEGSLIAWSELHGGDYRVRLVSRDLRRRERVAFVGPRGSVSPRLLASEPRAILLYKAVIGDVWTALELDADGTPLRTALAAVPGYEPPALVDAGETLRFDWTAHPPEGPFTPSAEQAFEMEVPWQAFEPESLDSVPALESRAAPSGSGPPALSGAGAIYYRAFGDSVTRGSGWPLLPSIVFDIADDGEGDPPGPACAQSADTFNVLCGYNWRLENTLDGSFASDVANDGSGGETTVAGVTRVEGILAGTGDVLLVMEGSNDLTNCATSTATVRGNIGQIVDKATAAGFDTVVASVAKRRKVDSNGVYIPNACENAATADLAIKLQTLANDKNRAFADVYNTIDPALGQTDYWNAGGGQNDPVGHPDASGYVKIEPKFSAAILADSPLGPPNPLTPAGDVTANPTFSWDEEAGARLYRLSVTGPGAPADSWHDSLAICAASVCSVSLGALQAGSYSWKVAGKNLRGLGSFSADQPFEVFTTVPGVPTPVGPSDETFDDTPEYSWLHVEQASDYTVVVTGPGGFTRGYSASAVCTGSVCAIEPFDVLAIGAHTWRVRAENVVGLGTFSAYEAFEVLDCSLFPANLTLDDSDTGPNTYRACPGTVTTLAGFVVSTGETVTLHGAAGVVLEAIEVQAGATLTVKSN